MAYRDFLVEERIVETPSVTTLHLIPGNGELSSFTPGQFVNVALPQFGPEAKSYSIGSVPGNGALAISVRAKGEFSQALSSLRSGDTLSVSEPCGFFSAEDETTPRIFAAAGIGIVPFMGMLRDQRVRGVAVPTDLLYGTRTFADTPFAAELSEHERAGRCTVTYFVTGEPSLEPRPDAIRAPVGHRIGTADLAGAREHSPRANFFLCGGIPFVRDMRLALRGLGVPEEAIFTEAFF